MSDSALHIRNVPAGSLKKFAIEYKDDPLSSELHRQILDQLKAKQMIYDENEPDLVISIGGDGTLLHAFHTYTHRLNTTAFVGVHTGHLGFYADWTSGEVDGLVEAIIGKSFDLVEYPLLHIGVHYSDNAKPDDLLALNECTVRSASGLLVADVLIKGEKFESFRGDGLCFSTPTGSTAYNKGLSGALVHPSLPSIQLTEIASINNRVFRTVGSPLILPQHHRCQVMPVADRAFTLSVDHLSRVHEDVKKIEFGVAEERIRFARFRPFPFWRRVRDSFIG
ncbi:NAD kinase [Sporolactobacillus inulinus]|jgi:NAD+ kinase|uniref:NAD kinase n=2 Tax=Sporolactobacillus inulinus TaxID=2078 RepID=A0A4Y1ZA12_9BACL|nr:NAD kinase [Sporolactobacillus inulinus]KLI03789.1 inorganic polyphosphate kinase [Sporolactobacillus inulinus CASD]GAY75854.1 NAD kinase [Sporolactobacillus inulinus]GEB76536.1 NAD kinase 1 [Sporolactobacillus inulinus]